MTEQLTTPVATGPGSYPVGFRFGVATAAYQVEGATTEDGRGPSIWDVFCARRGTIADGSDGSVACDHYHRLQEDLDLMAGLGVESYRFSIAWSRVQPTGSGRVNPAGLDFYRRVAEGCLQRGIEPLATLYHWDLPQALQEAGGWAQRATAERFAEYAGIAADALGDVVDAWITHNEPWVVAILGHAEGRKAPGVRDWPTALRVAHHLMLSHGLAADAIRARRPDVEVGITLNLTPVRPASSSDADVAAARRVDGSMNRWFLDPVLLGSYPEDAWAEAEAAHGPLDVVHPGDLEVISRPLDFLGVNYYFPLTVRDDPDAGPLRAATVAPEGITTAMGWPVDATALEDLLERLTTEYPPVPLFLTENGAAFEDPQVDDEGRVRDPQRRQYVEEHLAAVRRAAAAGADVRRYCLWSLLDNFEWEHGYGMRFGIVHVDYDTLVRTPKDSARWYAEHIREHRAPPAAGGGS